jgi:hypothetical protein
MKTMTDNLLFAALALGIILVMMVHRDAFTNLGAFLAQP